MAARRSKLRNGVLVLCWLVVVALIFVAICNAVVLFWTRALIYDRSADVPRRDVAIVFGAGLEAPGKPSAMLADRLDGAFDLYRAHKVHLVLLTGDNGTVQYNELAAMVAYSREHGMPEKSIAADYAGFNTYDSCYRAKKIFGVRSAVLVTQSFHLARALFLCRSMGIDAVGYPRPDWGVYDNSMMFDEDVVRESLARVKALIQARFIKPLPPVMGPPLPLKL